jgi:hypothetical protein
VDGLDTAIVMNLKEIVTKQVAFIATVDFTYVYLSYVNLITRVIPADS